LGEARAKLNCFGLQRLVRERFHGGLKFIDGRNQFCQAANLLTVTGAQDL
jgi:hypothetical protein